MNILVVDDEKEIADVIELYLQNDQYNVFKFYTGQEALDFLKSTKVDMAILDIMLPDVDGFQILKQIREKYTFPVIMLTAKTEYMDKITGLTLGADDYIPKPFNPLELVARVKAQIRRYTQYNDGGRDPGDVWHEKYYKNSNNTVMVHIRHLREKMNGPTGKSDFIKTVWGVGYKVEE